VGTNIDTKVQLGAWSWDMATCDEFRVGAGIAEPYPITWCAVEYFEASGTILQLLLQRLSPNSYHNGRTWYEPN
nr:ankyrin-3 isoform X2 [Tanacetum cinerariifolium]